MVSYLQVSPPKHCQHLSSPPYALHALPISFFSIPTVPAMSQLDPIHIIPSSFFDITFISSCRLGLGLFPSGLCTKALFAFPSWPVPWNKNEFFTYAFIKSEPVHGLTIHNTFYTHLSAFYTDNSNYRCVVLQEITELPRVGSGNSTSSYLHCFVGVSQQAINTAMNNTFAVTATQSLSLLFKRRLTSISLLTAKSPDEVSSYSLLVFSDVICSAT